jgi:hypothetical protein
MEGTAPNPTALRCAALAARLSASAATMASLGPGPSTAVTSSTRLELRLELLDRMRWPDCCRRTHPSYKNQTDKEPHRRTWQQAYPDSGASGDHCSDPISTAGLVIR